MTLQEVYNFMNGRDASASFSDPSHKSEISFSEFVNAMLEEKRVLSAVFEFCRNNPEATKLDVVSTINSELDVEMVIDNFTDSWEAFVEGLNNPEEI